MLHANIVKITGMITLVMYPIDGSRAIVIAGKKSKNNRIAGIINYHHAFQISLLDSNIAHIHQQHIESLSQRSDSH